MAQQFGRGHVERKSGLQTLVSTLFSEFTEISADGGQADIVGEYSEKDRRFPW